MGTGLVLFLSREYLIPTRTMGSRDMTEIGLCIWISCGCKKSEKSSMIASTVCRFVVNLGPVVQN